jgi:hypothetical protein
MTVSDADERRILTTPGVAEGFDEACREIEACKLRLDEATVLRLEPGDIIVYKAQRAMTQHMLEHARETLAATFPGYRVLVLDEGSDLSVARSGGEAEGQA